MRANGQLRTCDRCGASVFLKVTGEGERDGGFTRWNKFEEAEGWSTEVDMGDLCPKCTEELKQLMDNFMREKAAFMKEAKP